MKTKITKNPVLITSIFLIVVLLSGNFLLAQVPYTMGNGIEENYPGDYPAPYGNYEDGARHQFLFLATELTASGMSTGPILSLAFYVKDVNGIPLDNFEIKMGTTSQTEMFLWETGLTTVYSTTAYTDVPGWNTHVFQNPFIWDGSSNIVIETCFENSSTSSNAIFYQSYTSYFTTIVYYESTYGGPSVGICSNNPPWGNTYDMRPNMQFTMPSNLINDMGVVSWEAPVSGCNLSSGESVTVKIKNNGTAVQSSYNLSYSVDDGASFITEIVNQSINPGDTISYTFNAIADFSSLGTYECSAVVYLAGDEAAFNDTLAGIVVKNFPLINSYPYLEDFEGGDGGWIQDGINSSWANGTPNGYVITYAASGVNAWVTGLDGDYNANERSYVESPCLDFSALTNPVFEFKLWMETGDWEHGAAVQYSTDGITWNLLGQYISNPILPDNWYNSDQIISLAYFGTNDGWTGNAGMWETAAYSLASLAGEAYVKLRIVFGSNQWGNNWDGFAFDDIHIYQPPDMTYVSSTATQNNTDSTIQGAYDQEIIGIKVVTNSSTNPVNITKFLLSTSGSTDPNDINDAIIYYTGNNNTFASTDTFGLVAAPNGNFTIIGNQPLAEDTNYFWLAYNISVTAIPGDVLDAVCDSVTVADTSRIPTLSSPPGNRTILEALAGTYYINPDGTKDYISFNDAVNDLIILGVKGPVIFNVDTGSYNEQIDIPKILGASVINTVTFQSTLMDSSSVHLAYSPNAADNYVISLSEAEYIRFQHLTISATGTDYSRVIV
ncbi:MAG: hypothetical protein K8S00_05455, partial [Bacteroidales bacterium]|nr:hypothetical protein [Bacteroidales bacterium]